MKMHEMDLIEFLIKKDTLILQKVLKTTEKILLKCV